jgi:hypothetical protein
VATKFQLIVNGSALPVHVHCCDTFLTRLRGMFGFGYQHHLDAWCLHRCRAVHTFLPARPVDVVFCDARGDVLRVCTPLPARRWACCRGADCVWEFFAGESARWQLRPGQRLGCRALP